MTKEEIFDLLSEWRLRGIHIYAQEGKLCYKGLKDTITDMDIQLMRGNKEQILQFLEDHKEIAFTHDEGNRYEPFTLTDVQTAYLLGREDLFEYGGVACHIYMELNYPSLSKEKVEKIWNCLIKRHDMLRAVFINGSQQVLAEVPDFEVPYTDITAAGEEELSAGLAEIRNQMGHRIYKADQWPLFEIRVCKDKQHSILHFSMDFLIADWYSMTMLMGEFERLYDSQAYQLPQLEITFRDYQIYEKSRKETFSYLDDKKYWLDRIKQFPKAPELPGLKKNDSVAAFKRRRFHINSECWRNIKKEAARAGITPSNVVLAAYAAVIERWSQSERFCLNLTLLNRRPVHPQINEIVGDFTSVNMLEINWNSGNSFILQCQNIQKQLMNDLEHRLFTGVEVLREVARYHGKSSALMPVVFTSAIGLRGESEQVALKGEISDYGISQTPQVFIDCQVMDDETGLHINWDTRTGVIPEEVLTEMLGAYEKLLNELGTMEDVWKNENNIGLPSMQLEERLHANDTEQEKYKGKTLHEGFFKMAEAQPGAIAVVDENGEYSYGDLEKLSRTIALHLKKKGVSSQDKIAIIMDKGVCQAAAVIGILSIGAVYVPIDTKQPKARQILILEQAGINVILIHSTEGLDFPEKFETIEADKLEQSNEKLEITYPAEDPAYILFTSGSTGIPKGVVITHQSAMNTISDINDRFHINQSDKVLGLAKLSFDLSVFDLFGILSVGGTIVYPHQSRVHDPSHWLELIVENKITIWNSVPAMMQMLKNYMDDSTFERKRIKLRTALLSGDWIPISLPDEMRKKIPELTIVSLGGATEASIWSIYHVYAKLKDNWTSIPYGRPLANQQFYILDKKMRDCPDGVSGDIYIAGYGLACGYLHDEEKTSLQFIYDPVRKIRLYKTGDIGRYMAGGEIEFLGRCDNQVKIRGHRIETGEIEAALMEMEGISEAAIIFVKKNEEACLCGFTTDKADEEEIKAYLKTKLPSYMIPAHICSVEKLPLTANGKIDRALLTEWAAGYLKSEPADEPEEFSKFQQIIAGDCKEVFKIQKIGIKQNFYDLGADSLIIAQLAGKLHGTLKKEGIELSFDVLLRLILNSPTLELLSAALQKKEEKQEPDCDQSNGIFTEYGGGDGKILRVVFHSGIGTTNNYFYLIKQLAKQNKGLVLGIALADTKKYCQMEPEKLIEELAEDYSAGILKYGPEKVQLIGHSIGGMIALETSRILMQNKIDILDLTVIDSSPMLFEIACPLALEALFVPNMNIDFADTGIADMNKKDIMDALLGLYQYGGNNIPYDLDLDKAVTLEEKGRKLFETLASMSEKERFIMYAGALGRKVGKDIPVDMIYSMFHVFCQSLNAAMFIPLPYVGDIRLLLAKTQEFFMPDSGDQTVEFWQDTCLGEFSMILVEGDHFECVANESNAFKIAELLDIIE